MYLGDIQIKEGLDLIDVEVATQSFAFPPSFSLGLTSTGTPHG
jgi:hypothetical protein